MYFSATAEWYRTTPRMRVGVIASAWGGRMEFMSRVRSALSPWIDLRNRADVVRDQLEERGLADSRQFETVR
jgi:hypothetical protein